MVSVEDSVAVVTGGRQGLGAALVDELLARGATKVYSTGRQDFTDPRPRVSPQVLDVCDERSVTQLAAVATDATIVVNNAGISLPGPLLTADLSDVRKTFETNVHVSFIDTAMVADVAVAKTSPAEVARRIVDALEADGREVLVDETSKQAKAALSGPVENLVIDRF